MVLFNIQWNQWEYSGFNHGNIVALFMGNIVVKPLYSTFSGTNGNIVVLIMGI